MQFNYKCGCSLIWFRLKCLPDMVKGVILLTVTTLNLHGWFNVLTWPFRRTSSQALSSGTLCGKPKPFSNGWVPLKCPLKISECPMSLTGWSKASWDIREGSPSTALRTDDIMVSMVCLGLDWLPTQAWVGSVTGIHPGPVCSCR